MVLGIDEHTAVIVQSGQEEGQVLGVGGVAVLRAGESRRIEAPSAFPLAWLGNFQMPDPLKGAIPEDVWHRIDEAQQTAEAAKRPPVEVLELVSTRKAARARSEWQAADALRAQIERLGWMIEDTPDGPRLTPTP